MEEGILGVELQDLMDQVCDWMAKKLEEGSGFSLLIVSQHPDGNRMMSVTGDDIDDAHRLLLGQRDYFDTAERYALAYDASISDEGEVTHFALIRTEERGEGRIDYYGKIYEWIEDTGGPRRIEYQDKWMRTTYDGLEEKLLG